MPTEYTTQILAKYIVRETYRALPDEVVLQAKKCIQDSVACLMGAYATSVADVFKKYVDSASGGGEVHLLGSDLKTDPSTAAFANAMLFNAMDFDDIYDTGHLGATVMAAGFSGGELVGCTGQELIEAVSVGYEVSGRLGLSLSHLKPRKTVHGHGTWQIFGATATAAKLLKLNEVQTAHALALSAANAPVPSVMKTVYGATGASMAKNNFGAAAQAGVTAVFLAKEGFEGPLDIFEGDTGFARMIGVDSFNPEIAIQDLGSQYEILNVGFKTHSCCRILHSSVHAVLNACKENDVDVGEISGIVLESPAIVCEWPFANWRPDTMQSAQFSAPYAVAASLLGYDPGPEWFLESRFSESSIIALMDKIELKPIVQSKQPDSGRKYHSAAATVHMSDQQSYYAHVDIAPGEAARPLAQDHLDRKFANLTRQCMSAEKSSGLLSRIKALENEKSIDALINIMCAHHA